MAAVCQMHYKSGCCLVGFISQKFSDQITEHLRLNIWFFMVAFKRSLKTGQTELHTYVGDALISCSNEAPSISVSLERNQRVSHAKVD